MDAPEEIDVTFLISDLSGYTALTEAHGDRYAAEVIRRYVELSDSLLTESARRVERVGDELLIVADVPADAVRAAVRLRAIVEQEPRFITVRCGVHRGTVILQGGNYVGAALNLTARITGHARSGQILCTQPVADAAVDLPDIMYRPRGQIRFKNVPEPVLVFEVVCGERGAVDASVDPVCHMLVTPDAAAAMLSFESEVYYFCSFECAKRFAARPEDYVRR